MPLPDAGDPEKSILYQQLRSKKLEDLTPDQLDEWRDQIFVNGDNEDDIRRLILLYVASGNLGTSPIPRTLKLLNYAFTSTGNNYEDLGINPGEVWKINTLSMAEQGTGTATVSFSLYDGTHQSFFAIQSTTSQEPVVIDMYSPIYITSDFRINMLVNNTGGTGVEVDISLIRVS